jgi:hypothetical protein
LDFNDTVSSTFDLKFIFGVHHHSFLIYESTLQTVYDIQATTSNFTRVTLYQPISTSLFKQRGPDVWLSLCSLKDFLHQSSPIVHIMPNVEQPLRQRHHSIYEQEEETKEQGVPLNETTSSDDLQPKIPTNKYLELYREHLKPVLSPEEQSKVFQGVK